MIVDLLYLICYVKVSAKIRHSVQALRRKSLCQKLVPRFCHAFCFLRAFTSYCCFPFAPGPTHKVSDGAKSQQCCLGGCRVSRGRGPAFAHIANPAPLSAGRRRSSAFTRQSPPSAANATANIFERSPDFACRTLVWLRPVFG